MPADGIADRSEVEMGGGDGLATGMRRFAAWKSPGDRQETGAEATKQLELNQSISQ
jgi:hypothetical protein